MFFKGHLRLGTLFPRGPSGFFTIEIINNTRGGIEGKIGERGVWGANSSPGCSLIHDVLDKKSRFRRIFQLFFAVKILKISFQTV